jgi:hypothetical protein
MRPGSQRGAFGAGFHVIDSVCRADRIGPEITACRRAAKLCRAERCRAGGKAAQGLPRDSRVADHAIQAVFGRVPHLYHTASCTDVDLYQPTLSSLEFFYPLLAPRRDRVRCFRLARRRRAIGCSAAITDQFLRSPHSSRR